MTTNETTTKKLKEWLNAKEATEYLGVSRTTLYKLMDEGALPFQNVKGVQKRRISKADLDALLQSSKVLALPQKNRQKKSS